MKRLTGVLLLAVLLMAQACSIGSARSIDIRKDLSGLDLAYMRGKVKALHDENTQSVDGRLSGFPFWFLPATLSAEGSKSLHRGEVVEEESMTKKKRSEISGFEHTNMRALGLGLLAYRGKEATWNADGGLEQWRYDMTLGAGLLYNRHVEGDGALADSMRTHVLAGAFGYSETHGRGYLSVLWIPIPVRW